MGHDKVWWQDRFSADRTCSLRRLRSSFSTVRQKKHHYQLLLSAEYRWANENAKSQSQSDAPLINTDLVYFSYVFQLLYREDGEELALLDVENIE